VGTSTHPGTGVPIVLAGAKVTASQILSDFKIKSLGRGKKRLKGRRRGRLIRCRGMVR
jgi:phytoene desaturase (3,4-didehydrolycopene-forming)